MKPRHPHIVWPPLVRPLHISAWIRLRDSLITILAWALMVWLIRHELNVLIDYLRPPVFRLTRVSVPDWAMIWERFKGFILLSAVLIGWIGVWGIRRRRIVYRLPAAPEPAPLALEAHARAWGLSPESVEASRHFKVVRADFDSDGRLVAFEPGDNSKPPTP